MKKYFLLLFFCLSVYTVVLAQTAISKDSIAGTPIKSNLSYEALTQFFQSSITTGRNGGFNFKSSLFGIDKLFSKKDIDLSDYYLKRKQERNTEFAIGVFKDGKGNLNTIQAGFKYALINNRSKSDINFTGIPEIAKGIQNMGAALYDAEKIYGHIIDRATSAAKAKLEKELDNALKKYTKSQNIKDLPGDMQVIIDSLVRKRYASDTATFFHLPQKLYDIAAKRIDQKGLLTLSFNPGYAWSGRRFDSSTLMLQYLKGFGNFDKPWNVDGQLRNYFLHDTTSSNKNLSRSIAVVIVGVNKILVNDDKRNPILEFEMALEDDYIHEGLYANEEKNKINLNTTLRVHISREITVPVTLQFDLKHPGLSGFLKVDWNLENDKKGD